VNRFETAVLANNDDAPVKRGICGDPCKMLLFILLPYHFSTYSIGNSNSSAILKKHARVSFSKTTKVTS
jgi:hypothetical protein